MLSIIITHYKTPAMLKLCLRNIRQHIGGIEHEIIVADGAADTEAQEIIRQLFPETFFISFVENVGYAKLVNAGLKTAKGDYALILNADIFILPGSVERLIAFMNQHADIGVVGPQLLTFTNRRQESCFRFPTAGAILARRTAFGRTGWGKKYLADYLYRNAKLSSWQYVDWVQGSAMLVRRAAVDKVGLLDERFFMYLEDTDWCKRFNQHGYKVAYHPEAQMHHYYYRNSKKWGGVFDILLNKYTRIHIASTIKYFLKHK